ncbi:hypothetical protein CPBF426_39690 [Xanthomonas arboricola pv. juglandis]|nr:hypothetical protein CPBF426_39690 [Xanthomonas arboricola pv. juglandis]
MLSPRRCRPDLRPGNVHLDGRAVPSGFQSRPDNRFLLPQAGEGARRADEGLRAQSSPLPGRSTTRKRSPGWRLFRPHRSPGRTTASFSRAREKVPAGRMRGWVLSPWRCRPDLRPGNIHLDGGAVPVASQSRPDNRFLLPQAGEGARRADEGLGAQSLPLPARSTTRKRSPGWRSRSGRIAVPAGQPLPSPAGGRRCPKGG